MAMRSYRYFVCANGHSGVETKSENDQPYSGSWESMNTDGMRKHGTDSLGFTAYICEKCSLPMAETKRPQS
jgi:hypothetical protein